MKYLTFLLTLLSLGPAVAQSLFKVGHTQLDFPLCQENHNKILARELAQLDSEIGRLVKGIKTESEGDTPPHRLEALKKMLAQIILKRALIGEIQRKFNAIKLEEKFNWTSESDPYRIYNTDKISLDMSKQFDLIVTKAVASQGTLIKNYVTKEFKFRILTNIGSELSERAYTSLGNGFAAKMVAKSVLSAGMKPLATGGVLLSFGAEVLKGAVVSTIVNILVSPLKGNRAPPETLWIELLQEYPALLVNPEWMNSAGIDDHPWKTHCFALERRTSAMERRLKAMLEGEEYAFQNKIREIQSLKTPQQIEEERYCVAQDNTRVKKLMRALITAPSWTKK